jgi:hypothetical protein
MSQDAISMKLTEKVSTVLAAVAGNGFVDPVQTISVYPRTADRGLTDFEADCRDWGFVFGLAYGIARGEEPYESDDSVCERAMTAAREVFSRFSKSDIFTEEAFLADRATRPDAREFVLGPDSGDSAPSSNGDGFVDQVA